MSAVFEARKTPEILNVFHWNIRNFRSFARSPRDVGLGVRTRTIISPIFVGKSVSLPNSFWQIIVQVPEVLPTDNVQEKRVQVYLHFKKGTPGMSGRAQLSLVLNTNREVYNSQLWEGTFEGRDSLPKESETLNIPLISGFSTIPSILALVVNDLHIKVKLWIDDVLNEAVSPTKDPQPKTHHSNFLQLLNSPEFSDVSIVAEDKVFKAHKSILGCLSPVFAAMFRNPMSESLSNTVKIDDFSSRTVRGMLQFIYGGSLEAVKDDFKELLKIADKYQLEGLKTECINAAILKISTENMLELLIVGHLYNAPELKTKAMNFINSNTGNWLFSLGNENAAFKKFAKVPNLILEMYENVLRNNSAPADYLEESKDAIIEGTITTTYNT